MLFMTPERNTGQKGLKMENRKTEQNRNSQNPNLKKQHFLGGRGKAMESILISEVLKHVDMPNKQKEFLIDGVKCVCRTNSQLWDLSLSLPFSF